ncbi:conserved hypothetical protein [Xenorhabdus bovienii str. puntauvense]|uniref:Uncharacterized protein n=2 Tax=Xenorhabdus bovienii TaxID=40576 RepID=A0A077NLJ6_XENBV|nr:conserved hypothetical protein [Xenorhabdus bovienii str. feltiae Florida]CDG99167.1 conserved hypothetical protein [Xenorhabdus bovienii str. puntauvense]CDH01781.1 conserved hypothetical protein [Xenorhabdus bovienii str. feltiae Moldova]
MVATTFGCQPDLMKGFLAIDNDFAAVFESQRHYAAVCFTVNIGIAIVVIQLLFNTLHQLIGQLMKFAIVHVHFLFAFQGLTAIIESIGA